MKVKKAMTREVQCCTPFDTIADVARMMRDGDVGAIPVIKDRESRQLAGIITDRDICCRVTVTGKAPNSVRVQKVMTPKPVACHPEDALDDCARMMQKHRVRRLPVVDEKGAVVGIIAQGDIARHLKASTVGRTVAKISIPTRAKRTARMAA
ncbi:MAG: CBS domain-containing protein [Acidobacteriota bacterium]|nr:CBS domain-containing protein [Acidobacteriota bacterium]